MFGVMTPLIGGALIGLAASLLLLSHGKVAGISGIVGGVLKGEALSWRLPFAIGLLVSAPIMMLATEESAALFANSLSKGTSLTMTIVAGLLVGLGSRLGNGCTSGHGVCGLARASNRSIAATLTFMSTGAIAAYVVQHVLS